MTDTITVEDRSAVDVLPAGTVLQSAETGGRSVFFRLGLDWDSDGDRSAELWESTHAPSLQYSSGVISSDLPAIVLNPEILGEFELTVDPVGSTVFVVGNDSSGHYFDIGDEVKVMADLDDLGRYQLCDDNGLRQWLFPNDIDIDPPVQPDPIDSIVYVTGDTENWSHDFEVGTEVTVQGYDQYDGSYLVSGARRSYEEKYTEQWVSSVDLDVEPPLIPLADWERALIEPDPSKVELKAGDLAFIWPERGSLAPWRGFPVQLRDADDTSYGSAPVRGIAPRPDGIDCAEFYWDRSQLVTYAQLLSLEV